MGLTTSFTRDLPRGVGRPVMLAWVEHYKEDSPEGETYWGAWVTELRLSVPVR
jgi:hypothetical protein